MFEICSILILRRNTISEILGVIQSPRFKIVQTVYYDSSDNFVDLFSGKFSIVYFVIQNTNLPMKNR